MTIQQEGGIPAPKNHLVETRISPAEYHALNEVMSHDGFKTRSAFLRHLIQRELRQRAALPE